MTQKTVRLFFALWPDETIRKQLMLVADSIKLQCKGRLVRQANLHMTLHFIGNTSLENVQCLEQQAASATKFNPFIVQLNKTGEFNRAGIVWMGCKSPAGALLDLQYQLGQHISDCDFIPEKRCFVPHVTLYRNAALPGKPGKILPVDWKIEGFSLIKSEQDREGVAYREIRSYRFRD